MGKSVLTTPNPYHLSKTKRIFDIALSLVGIILLSPLFLLISVLIKTTSKGSIFFIQKRSGIKDKSFKIVKFRTMKTSSASRQRLLQKQNEADGPVFKIQNDPRFTKFGKILSRTGLDELPQLINVLKGEMSLVGPRPLPVLEASKLTAKQKQRQLIKPGLTSLWVVNGSHRLNFDTWMKLDQQYLKKASFFLDITILSKTALIVLKSGLCVIRSLFSPQ